MVISFYSYKGGVGRTKVMICSAALLAMKGYKVALLDFDLEASSLATFFGDNKEDIGERELLTILVKAKLSLIPDSLISINQLLEKRFRRKPPAPGSLKYIPTISDPLKLDDIRFNKPMMFFMGSMKDDILNNCGIDILFVDLRAGWSNATGLIMPLVDGAVIVTRLDDQNIKGLSEVIPIMTKRKIDPVLVINQVPNSARTQERISYLKRTINRPIDVRIDYDPELIFDNDFERLVDPKSSIRMGTEALIEKLGIEGE